jgi:hypothetical protein
MPAPCPYRTSPAVVTSRRRPDKPDQVCALSSTVRPVVAALASLGCAGWSSRSMGYIIIVLQRRRSYQFHPRWGATSVHSWERQNPPFLRLRRRRACDRTRNQTNTPAADRSQVLCSRYAESLVQYVRHVSPDRAKPGRRDCSGCAAMSLPHSNLARIPGGGENPKSPRAITASRPPWHSSCSACRFFARASTSSGERSARNFASHSVKISA